MSGAHPEGFAIVTVFEAPDGIATFTVTVPTVFQSAVAGKLTVVAVPPLTCTVAVRATAEMYAIWKLDTPPATPVNVSVAPLPT
jgi:hypothetical protein